MLLLAKRQEIDAALNQLSETGLDGVPNSLLEPIRYAIAGEGKRLRPILSLLTYEAAGGKQDISPLAIAVELIHTYSLVHDDLPCMDDDDVRRGRPTVHKKFDARRAILAGAVLIPIAVRTIFRAGKALGFTDAKCAELVAILLRAAGAGGMIGGQFRDLSAEGASLSLKEMESIHGAKTGNLILAAVRIGAIAADAPPDHLTAVETFGSNLGLAFQIMDDVLDVTQTTATIGKTAGRDAALRKSTYPTLLGVELARLRAEELVRRGLSALAPCGLLTANLNQVASFILARNA